jgi:zinc and cadmium transporter
VLASLLGGWLSSLVNLTHTVSQTIISFVGGLMLGIGVFHLFPHSLHGGQTASEAAGWMMCGIVAMFLLIRWFHFHHHGPLEISTDREDPCAGQHADKSAGSSLLVQLGAGSTVCDHTGEHVHGDHGGLVQRAAPATAPHCHHAHQLSWVGILIGLSLHTLLDGMALAASVAAESRHSVLFSLFGFGTLECSSAFPRESGICPDVSAWGAVVCAGSDSEWWCGGGCGFRDAGIFCGCVYLYCSE